jgi:hypothetical protein
MSYFRTKKEALHLAISQDGYNWKSLNRNRPILSSHLGTRTMRDPFLFRDRNHLFHLLTTDGWTNPYIIHAWSEDLLTWKEMTALPVMADIPGARNSWAPEAFYDAEKDLYRLIWSSTVSTDGPPDLRDHRIWSATTEDFREFSLSSLFFDPGYNVIDATVCRAGNQYVMAFKDERGDNKPDTPFKGIRLSTSTGDCNSFDNISGILTPPVTEGPVLFRCHDRWMLFYDCYMDGHWGASASVDLESWVTITKGVKFPKGPRHGSVIEVEKEVYRRLEGLL